MGKWFTLIFPYVIDDYVKTQEKHIPKLLLLHVIHLTFHWHQKMYKTWGQINRKKKVNPCDKRTQFTNL